MGGGIAGGGGLGGTLKGAQDRTEMCMGGGGMGSIMGDCKGGDRTG